MVGKGEASMERGISSIRLSEEVGEGGEICVYNLWGKLAGEVLLRYFYYILRNNVRVVT